MATNQLDLSIILTRCNYSDYSQHELLWMASVAIHVSIYYFIPVSTVLNSCSARTVFYIIQRFTTAVRLKCYQRVEIQPKPSHFTNLPVERCWNTKPVYFISGKTEVYICRGQDSRITIAQGNETKVILGFSNLYGILVRGYQKLY